MLSDMMDKYYESFGKILIMEILNMIQKFLIQILICTQVIISGQFQKFMTQILILANWLINLNFYQLDLMILIQNLKLMPDIGKKKI